MAIETGNDSGAKTLFKEKVWVGAKVFKITEDIIIKFKNLSCNILDSEKNILY
jgi:hypothetical protein